MESKKDQHIHINLTKDVNSYLTNGLEMVHLIHNALPEIAFNEVDPSTTLFQRKLNFPVLISSMTGGTPQTAKINKNLAAAAQEFRLAMGVGSQRIALENSNTEYSFNVRAIAPDVLLFANLGAVQLNYGYSVEHCKRAVDSINADALILHLNPLQEALMENGDTNFSGLLKRIEKVCTKLEVPVVVKEVGWGISTSVARRLIEAGVQAIDVAGAGGTSWSEVEKHRAVNSIQKNIADAFKFWGIPTAKTMTDLHSAYPEAIIFASGGLTDGVDIVKCIALGARLGGMARPFLHSAAKSAEEVEITAQVITAQIRTAMFALGARTLADINIHSIYIDSR